MKISWVVQGLDPELPALRKIASRDSSCGLLFYSLAPSLFITFIGTMLMHEKYNRIDPNSSSLSVFGVTSSLTIQNCDVYS